MREPESEPQSPGTLYVVATPIGNLEDLSPHAERILSEASLIAAEDTRVTRRLLAQRGLGKQPMLSFHDHNELQRTREILRKLQDGRDVALVSDAGTPLISDPGYRLVRAAVEAGLRVVAIPGPSAVVAALSISGLPTDRFLVLGFLHRRAAKRRTAFEELRRERSTLVLFEAPHRMIETLEDLEAVLGDRQVVLARNLTKPHEQVLRGRASEVRAVLAAQEFVAGELTLVVEGAGDPEGEAWPEAVERAIERLLAEGLPPSQVQSIVSDVFELNRKSVYQYILGKVREPIVETPRGGGNPRGGRLRGGDNTRPPEVRPRARGSWICLGAAGTSPSGLNRCRRFGDAPTGGSPRHGASLQWGGTLWRQEPPVRPPAHLLLLSPFMDEIRPEKSPGSAPAEEKQAAAEAGQAPRWGKGTEQAEDGHFLEGPHARSYELRRLFRIAADFIRGFRGLHFVGPCVTVFGSARFQQDHRYYEMAREMGSRLGRAGFTILTGGGPGIMEAANRGAREVAARSIGCNIILPKEQKPNPYLDRWVEFRYFFVRKVMLV